MKTFLSVVSALLLAACLTEGAVIRSQATALDLVRTRLALTEKERDELKDLAERAATAGEVLLDRLRDCEAERK